MEYCSRNGIKHELASAYNPESNGLPEAAVKIMKLLLSRCIRAKVNIQMVIAAWRNMARNGGQSPSQLFFGRIQRQRLPLTAGQAKNRSQCIETKDSMSKASTASRNLNTKDYDKLVSAKSGIRRLRLWRQEKAVAHRNDPDFFYAWVFNFHLIKLEPIVQAASFLLV